MISDQESFTRWKNNEIIIKIRDLEEIDYKVNNFKENLSLYNLEQVDSLEFVRNLNLDEYRELFKKIDFSNYAVLVNDVDNN